MLLPNAWMPLKERPNLANISRKDSVPPSAKTVGTPDTADNENDTHNTHIHVMKARSRSQTGSPREVRLRAWKLDTLSEAPQLTLDVDSPLDMAQVNGLFKEVTSPERPRIASGRLANSPIVRSAIYTSSEHSETPEPGVWSSAIGHASTGKSGRVIERLQGDIDRLHREKQLLKVRFEDSEKTNETISTRNQYLQDRNSNYEQSHEANLRQLARKERQVEELREELKRERAKTELAQETARVASANEESWRDQASLAKSFASQKESEYDTIVSCRNLDNERHQGSLNKVKSTFEVLLQQRQADLDSYKKLEIIAEQQRQTIGLLEDLTKRIAVNFKAYRNEIDTAIGEMREHVSSNDSTVAAKLEEMRRVTGEMQWVINIDKMVNREALGSTKSSR